MNEKLKRPVRVLVAKVGLDGHDRGAKVIATALRDAGMEVIYTGLRQTPEMVVNAALQEDVDAIGISILSGAHMTVFPRVISLMKEKGIGVNASAAGTAVAGASNMPFLKSSGYQYVSTGTGVSVAFSLNGVGNLTSATIDMSTNNHYSVFAGGSLTHPSVVATSDDLTVVAGMAKVRFVNLSPDNLNEKCYIGNVAIDSNVTSNTVTSFHTITPTTGSITMDDPATFPANLTQLGSATFSAGKIYTVMLTGTAAGSGAPALAISVITNY